MTIRLECDAPGCGKQAMALRVDAMGRMHCPPPWVVYGGSRTLVVCCAEHVNRAAQARPEVVPPLPPLVDRPARG
jgi:hypothetical protein